MVVPGTAEVVPLCRPVSLKNESIDVIRAFEPRAVFGPVSHDTHKGTVAHMKADLVQGSHDTKTQAARIMLFPRFSHDDKQQLAPRRRTTSFILAGYHSFNYSLMGENGFHAMRSLIDSVECYDLVYHDLDWALHIIGELHSKVCAR
jgi:HprK-related kinase A